MESASDKAPVSLVEAGSEAGEASPLPRTPTGSRPSAEAQRRRVTSKIVVVCSSVVAIAVVGICYALLSQ
jgi:hypothetical protein